MTNNSPVCGIFCSDLHFSEKPPVARSAEANWMNVQQGYVQQLRALQLAHNAPIFIAGDVFEKWNSSAHLIGNVINWFFGMDVYSIPGNHDIPNHNYLDLARSAYWVLVEAGLFKHLTPKLSATIGSMIVTGFPYGFEPCSIDSAATPPTCLSVALVHGYIWTSNTGHKDAAESHKVSQWRNKLGGYDAAFFGDNHKDFILQMGTPSIMNCGGFMRLHTDERDRKPCVGLLRTNGKIERHLLDVSLDKFLNIEEASAGLDASLEIDLVEFVDELANLHTEKLNYAKAVKAWLDKTTVPENVRTITLRCIGVNK